VIRALCWKEYREHRWLWLLMAGMTVVLVVALTLVLAPSGLGSAQGQQTRDILTGLVLVMGVTYGLVCGSVMLAGEHEGGTQVFLDTLSGRRAPVWKGKALAGAGLTLAQALLLVGLVPIFGLGFAKSPGSIVWLLPVLALDGYAWGLAASAVAPTAFLAAIFGSLFLGQAYGVVLGVGGLGITIPLRTALALGAVAFSRWKYCAPDRLRLAPAPAPLTVLRARAVRTSGWRVLLWLTWRQGKVEAFVVLAVAVLLGLSLALTDPLLVVSTALLVGVACGTAVFADEQAGGSFRFLGDQRLPPGRVWAVKTLCWFVWAVAATGAALIGMALLMAARSGERSAGRTSSLLDDLLGREPSLHILGIVGTALALVYGFVAGQLSGLVFRRRLAALAVAGSTGAVLTTLWLPSVLLGGLPWWQLFGPPLLLLAGGRLVMWWWASDRLTALRPMACLVGCVLLSALWMAGSLWWRVAEIPDVGPPFDRKAFVASLSEAEKSEAGEWIREGARELVEHEKQVTATLSPPKKRLPEAPAPAPKEQDEEAPREVEADVAEVEPTYHDLALEAIERGWPKEGAELGRWLDEVFAGKWTDKFRRAASAPLGLVQDPRRTSFSSVLSHLEGARSAGTLLAARAVQLQARGKHAAALEHLGVALGLSRQLRNDAEPIHVLTGIAIQNTALDGLDRWLEKLGPRKELLRRAGKELKRHEDRIPPLAGMVKAEYYALRNALEELTRPGGGLRGRLYALARQVPWEQERERRLLDAYFAHQLKLIEEPYWEAEPRRAAALARASAEGRDAGYMRNLENELEGQTWAAAPFWNSFLGRLLPGVSGGRWRTIRAKELCRFRAERLRIALALYQAETGKPASKLGDLVPRYLEKLPVDPFSGKSFHYRVSKDERIEDWSTDPNGVSQPRDVPAGQGILWSTGLDGKDNGGHRQGHPDQTVDPRMWAESGLDLIFLVPHWPKP
jgi:hypothetical protein